MSYSEAKKDCIFSMLGGRCYYCGCKLDRDTFRMDHFKSDVDSRKVAATLVPACPECNKGKCDLTVEQFREKLRTTVFNSLYGRLTSNYSGVSAPDKVIFYFEREGNT